MDQDVNGTADGIPQAHPEPVERSESRNRASRMVAGGYRVISATVKGECGLKPHSPFIVAELSEEGEER